MTMLASCPPDSNTLDRLLQIPSGAPGATPWPCWVEVDLDAIAHNVRVLHQTAAPRLGVTAVVKAQAYGLGATAVAEAAVKAGATSVAVARVPEGAQLRANGFQAPILLLGAITPAQALEVVRLRLTPTVTDWATATWLADASGRAGTRLGIHVKVDTGMNRYGASPAEAMALVRGLASLPSLRLDGFFTHFAAADEQDLWFARQQLAYYLSICRQLEAEGFNLGIKHAANSAGALRLPGAGLDAIRAGIALSGSHATRWVPRIAPLKSAVALKARVARLHTPPVGSSVGYGRTYKVEHPMRVALVTCGYADGLPRACSNRGWVLIRGRRARLVGTVSMDMAMAEVSHIPSVKVGDEVVILGCQGDDEITLDEFADSAGIIPHELLVRLGSRAPRLYLERGEPVRAASLSCDSETSFP
jgi:alanine racemase